MAQKYKGHCLGYTLGLTGTQVLQRPACEAGVQSWDTQRAAYKVPATPTLPSPPEGLHWGGWTLPDTDSIKEAVLQFCYH